MPRYSVNATISMSAWVFIEADSPEAAMVEAESYSPSDYDYDTGTASIEFDVTPAVEEYK